MNEAEWLAAMNPELMLKRAWKRFAREQRLSLFDRRLRLFACGCCRLVWELLGDKRSRTALERIERFADKSSEHKLRRTAEDIATDAFREMVGREWQADWWAVNAVRMAAGDSIPLGRLHGIEQALIAHRGMDPSGVRQLECELLRDIFGNPFRPATFPPEWRADNAVALASGMYESRDFSAMPILADALQDAGCDNADLLDHCRDPHASHVRGCWVVDLVLGRE